jgi:hypothetical protein
MYLLDANVFIQAKNSYYRFETFPTFWQWLDTAQDNTLLASIQPIYDELIRGRDELADWTKARKEGNWFLPVDDESTQQQLSEIAVWVMAQPFTSHAQDDFLRGGDPWLIAKAATLSATLVTLEKLDLKSKRKIFIPNVCRHFRVPYVDTFDMLRQLGARF